MGGNGKQNGSCCTGILEGIYGLYRESFGDHGRHNGNYFLGLWFRDWDIRIWRQ